VGDKPFIPASLDDNPHIDRDEYIKSLMHLDPVTREQLLKGDWTAREAGNKFKREWFEIVDSYPADARMVRYWDLAATEPKPGKDPDWTAGALMAERDGVYYIVDIKRTRTTPKGVEALIRQTAELDGRRITIYMEQEPGSSGVNTIDHYRRRILAGFTFYGNKTTGSKEMRANPVSSQAEAGNIKLVRGPWINDFLDEAELFPHGAHDDQVDAVSGAFGMLARRIRIGPVNKPSGW
jgi:predicted phage terminase large subunit-like protein